MHWPQITIIALMFLSVGMHLAKDGQPRDAKWSFGSALFSVAVWSTVLWYGGFWG